MMYRTRILSVAALALVGLAAGCSDSDDSAANGERRLRYAYAFTPVAALSPYSDDSVTTYGVGATETLLTLDPDSQLQPGLATDWRQVDDRTWEVELREGVSFHDGTTMTADVVAESLDHAVNAKPLPRTLTGIGYDAEAVGDLTVRITTDQADPVFVQRLSSPELAVLAPGAYEEDPSSPDPIGFGTGPYEIAALHGTSTMRLDAFANYWDGTPGLDGVDVDFIAEGDSRAAALRSGDVDVAWALPSAQLGRFDAEQLITIPLPRTVSIHLTESSEAFADRGLREAARAAIADLDIAGSIYGDHVTNADGFFAEDVSAWAAARSEADYPDAAVPDGEVIELATFSDRPEMVEIATVVADRWRDAGFEVKTIVREYNQLEEQFLNGSFDAVIMSRSYAFESPDPVSFLQTDFGCEGTYNISRTCVDEIDDALSAAATSSDVAVREAAAVDVEHTLLSDVQVIPLIHDAAQIGIADGVSQVASDPFERSVITADTTID
jgi:peptide/nickel transport system substrate-binding protein